MRAAQPNENGATFHAQRRPHRCCRSQIRAPRSPAARTSPRTPRSSYGCTSFNGNGFDGTLNPGCYSNLNLNGANVTLNPGIYVFNGGSNFNGAHVTGTGVTIYVTASGTPPNFNGANVTLSPPYERERRSAFCTIRCLPNTGSPNFNGSSNSYSGLMYAPSATSVNFNGAPGATWCWSSAPRTSTAATPKISQRLRRASVAHQERRCSRNEIIVYALARSDKGTSLSSSRSCCPC